MKNNSVELAKKIALLTSEVKAINPVILDLSQISSFTDYLIICSATSDRQTRAISDKVEKDLKQEGVRVLSIEGYDQGSWIVLDYFDVVLHVFTEELRQEYDLEGFWEKAKKVKMAPKSSRAKAVKAASEKSAPKKGVATKKASVKKKSSSVSSKKKK